MSEYMAYVSIIGIKSMNGCKVNLVRFAVEQVLHASEKYFRFQSSLNFETIAKGLETCVRIVVKDTASPLEVKDGFSICFPQCLAQSRNPITLFQWLSKWRKECILLKKHEVDPFPPSLTGGISLCSSSVSHLLHMYIWPDPEGWRLKYNSRVDLSLRACILLMVMKWFFLGMKYDWIVSLKFDLNSCPSTGKEISTF